MESTAMQTHTSTPAAPIQQYTALIRRKEVERLTSLSKSRIYALMNSGDFPKPVSLGAMSVAWLEVEVHEWIAQRIEAGRRTSCKAIAGGAQ
jgi:prophage regulatory protein